MTHKEIRSKFLNYFKDRGHTEIPSSSLVPEGDASVLFTTAGMQQLKPYFLGEESPYGKNVTSSQKCLRTNDIDEVGDSTHNTFFEMLGNFSFGGYWKKEAIQYAYDLITKEYGLVIDYVSVFVGDENTPADNESEDIWREIDPSLNIKKFGRADNFWGPTGDQGPCGPTTEIYVKGVEVWNLVFNEFFKDKEGNYTPLKQQGVDTGMGLERLLVQLGGQEHIYQTDLFTPILADIKEGDESSRRIIADHIRSSVFLISDGVYPKGTDQGYILRRLIRRAVRHANKIGMDSLVPLVDSVAKVYEGVYEFNIDKIKEVLGAEEQKFLKSLEKGLAEFEKGERDAFLLATSYGFPVEITMELAREKGETIDIEEFNKKMAEHQEKSRAGAEKKFK